MKFYFTDEEKGRHKNIVNLGPDGILSIDCIEVADIGSVNSFVIYGKHYIRGTEKNIIYEILLDEDEEEIETETATARSFLKASWGFIGVITESQSVEVIEEYDDGEVIKIKGKTFLIVRGYTRSNRAGIQCTYGTDACIYEQASEGDLNPVFGFNFETWDEYDSKVEDFLSSI